MNWNEFFFSDVGKKIKSIIRGVFYTEAILILIAGAIMELAAFVELLGGEVKFFLVMLAIPVGAVISIGALWLSTLLLYGFGEIVDTAIINREKESPITTTTKIIAQNVTQNTAQATNHKEDEVVFWICDCGIKNNETNSICRSCKKTRPSKVGISDYTKCICGAMVKRNQKCPLCGREVW